VDQLDIAAADLAVVGLYFAGVVSTGFYLARRTHDSTDLFLAGRRLGWLPIGLSLFASNISSTTLIGLAGAAYTWGVAVANYEWMAAPILVVFSVLLIPLYLRGRIGTVPEYLELRFDYRVRRYFSVLTLVSNIVVDTAGSLFAGALVLTGFFPALDLFFAALLLAAIAGVYTAAGGLAAVVYTDVLQAVVLLAGACLVALAYLVPPVAALFLLGALWRRPGPHAALTTLIAGHGLSVSLFLLNLSGVLDLQLTLVAGLIFGVSLMILFLAGLKWPPFAPAPNSVWTPDMARTDGLCPWWADYRVQSAAVLLLTAALVWTFR